jgi:hypothetical protein
VDISRAYWSRRTGVKAAELLRSKLSKFPQLFLGVERWSPARALSRLGPFLRRPPEGYRPDAQQSAPLISLPDARSAHLRRLAECGARVPAATDAVTKARFEQEEQEWLALARELSRSSTNSTGLLLHLERRFEWRFARDEEAHSSAI